MRLLPRLALSAPLLLAACQSAVAPGEGILCTGHMAPAVEVVVVDARSGAYVARGARGTVRDGSFSDTLSRARSLGAPPEDTLVSLQGAYERPGTYTVAVERAGYRPWQQGGVTVTRDACHVNTVLLTARLEPTS